MREQLIKEIQEMTDNILKIKKTYKIEFVNKPKIGVIGNVEVIDNNNMVIISFEDYNDTSDWLPISILNTQIIEEIHKEISNIFKEQIHKKIYALYKLVNGIQEYMEIFDYENECINKLKNMISSITENEDNYKLTLNKTRKTQYTIHYKDTICILWYEEYKLY